MELFEQYKSRNSIMRTFFRMHLRKYREMINFFRHDGCYFSLREARRMMRPEDSYRRSLVHRLCQSNNVDVLTHLRVIDNLILRVDYEDLLGESK